MSNRNKPYFPMFVDLSDKKVVVFGAGTIAKRRIRVLKEFTEHLVVIAPEVNKELKELEMSGELSILRRTYEREDLFDAALVIAATNDNRTNQDIYSACKCLGIPVNVCNDRTRCDFYFPAIAINEQHVVGVSGSGRGGHRTRELADEIQRLMGQEDSDAG